MVFEPELFSELFANAPNAFAWTIFPDEFCVESVCVLKSLLVILLALIPSIMANTLKKRF